MNRDIYSLMCCSSVVHEIAPVRCHCRWDSHKVNAWLSSLEQDSCYLLSIVRKSCVYIKLILHIPHSTLRDLFLERGSYLKTAVLQKLGKSYQPFSGKYTEHPVTDLDPNPNFHKSKLQLDKYTLGSNLPLRPLHRAIRSNTVVTIFSLTAVDFSWRL